MKSQCGSVGNAELSAQVQGHCKNIGRYEDKRGEGRGGEGGHRSIGIVRTRRDRGLREEEEWGANIQLLVRTTGMSSVTEC